MPRFSLETALKVRERLEKLYQKALAEQLQLEQRQSSTALSREGFFAEVCA